MAIKETSVWGIHAGRNGEAHTFFTKKNCIALGWQKIGDLNKLPADREDFKEHLVNVYPETKPGAIPINAGQLFRFVHEMKPDDLVVYPSKHDRQIHIGQVEGAYRYDPETEPAYPHVRQIKWLRTIPRSHFSQGALYEVGSAMSLFAVKNYAEEYRAAAEGKTTPPPVAQDETVAIVADDIQETTHDFIIKKLAQELKGHPFADFVAHLLEAMGYVTRVSPEGMDAGVDIIAHKDELGFEPPIIKVQVKSSEEKIGDPVVSALYGKVGGGEFGLVVTLGSYTNQAVSFARGKSNLRLIDGDELIDLILEHYDLFDSKYKGLIPLRKVFIPEVLEEGEE